MRCLVIELRETEIAALIREGLLASEARNDPNALRGALYDFFDCPPEPRRKRSLVARSPSVKAGIGGYRFRPICL